MENEMRVTLLTGGQDPHYALGLLGALRSKPIQVDIIGSDGMADCNVVKTGNFDFYNFVGNQSRVASLREKVLRILRYYIKLILYVAHTNAKLFHILWFRKFPNLEGTLLNMYFKILGKKIVFTAHNVDGRARDGKTTFANRLSLRLLYHIVDHILVHTPKMKFELIEDFGIAEAKVTVVPYGTNDVVPDASITRLEAKKQLGFGLDEKILLFFGNITPYKGLEDLLRALHELLREDAQFRLIIAGPVKNKDSEGYWYGLEQMIKDLHLSDYVRKESKFIPDEDIGVFFKASDVLVLPYKRIYQSGVLALSYRQGLPVISSDVGSLREDIAEGQTGLLFKEDDPLDLAEKIRMYFASDVYRELDTRSQSIREYGDRRFSWAQNVDRTYTVYKSVLSGTGNYSR
jgi:glycosyltransferase involved in cell wall biosynthesis